jgi:hypothetical protein
MEEYFSNYSWWEGVTISIGTNHNQPRIVVNRDTYFELEEQSLMMQYVIGWRMAAYRYNKIDS